MDVDTEMQSATAQGTEESKENEWVRINSNDGFSYLVRRKVAQTSGTMANMLDPNGGYAEAQTKICTVDERGIVTEKLVEYMCFKSHYQTVGPKEDIPVQEMQERIPPEIVLEVLLAADYHEM
ncbi:BTB/POZ protein [Ephemerocybe angulata]|nr:BTB/POZ protein [Tulosesus angulatus]